MPSLALLVLLCCNCIQGKLVISSKSSSYTSAKIYLSQPLPRHINKLPASSSNQHQCITGLPRLRQHLSRSASMALIIITSLLSIPSAKASADLIDLNTVQPTVTRSCWLDLQVGTEPIKRVQVALFGDEVPLTVKNFVRLCESTEEGKGYRGSSIFRIISTFSVQGGNIGQNANEPPSGLGRHGRAADGESFLPESFSIGHDYSEAGVVSMMKDLSAGGRQDSRFFITLRPLASWADGKYVAFGRVVKGMDTILALESLPVEPPSNYPITPVKIVDSGCYAEGI